MFLAFHEQKYTIIPHLSRASIRLLIICEEEVFKGDFRLKVINLKDLKVQYILNLHKRNAPHTHPVFTHSFFGVWRSLVAHYFGVVGVVGSNPATPTRSF